MNRMFEEEEEGYWVNQYNVNQFGCGRYAGPDPKWVDPNRTNEKHSHPYSYSEYFIFGSRATIKKSKGADYSDRLWEWDYTKADKLWKKHVDTGCNPSNGYPYWILWYGESK